MRALVLGSDDDKQDRLRKLDFAIEAVSPKLQHEHWSVRRFAVLALSAVCEALGGHRKGLRRIKERTMKLKFAPCFRITDPDEQVRLALAANLGRVAPLKSKEAVLSALQLASKDEDVEVQLHSLFDAMPRGRAPAVVLAPPPPPSKPPPAVATLPKSEVPKVRFDFGYDDIEGGNLLGKLLGSLQDGGQVDRAKPCQRCEVLLLQLDALAQSMVGLAGAAFRWSLEVATGVSTEDREMLWKALMSYMQPCAHVDARIASTSEDLLKAVTKAVTPDELLGSLAQQRLEQKRAQPKGAATAPQAKVKAKAEPKSHSAEYAKYAKRAPCSARPQPHSSRRGLV
eukprot:g33558.t1